MVYGKRLSYYHSNRQITSLIHQVYTLILDKSQLIKIIIVESICILIIAVRGLYRRGQVVLQQSILRPFEGTVFSIATTTKTCKVLFNFATTTKDCRVHFKLLSSGRERASSSIGWQSKGFVRRFGFL